VKTKFIYFVAAFIIAPQLPVTNANAGFLDDLMGNNSGYTQKHTVTNSGQPQNPGAVRYGAPAHSARPVPQQQPVIGQKPAAPKVAYQQPPMQNRTNTQPVASSKAISKKKPVRKATVNAVRPPVQAQAPNQRQQVVRSYQQNYPAQPLTVPQQSYNRAPAATSYANPYQTRYLTTPNYYQGYSYNNSWGSSTQACLPGKA
jgi:hypothetical protein